MMAENAGLCNICTELGAENFILVDKLLTRLGEMLRSQGKPDITPELKRKAKKLKGYLLSEFQANLKIHNDYATHYASLWLSDDLPPLPTGATSLNTRKLAKAILKYFT